MNRFKGLQSILTVALLLSADSTYAQRASSASKPNPRVVLERNIRAELGFLASDAMQGRGSGTPYERIAAEYIGSLFRQFGLEPVGDEQATGGRSFVQLPKRTIYFVCFGSEERGGRGARFFLANSPVPLETIVADINFEMLGRPDSKVERGYLWLTGYDRSNLGPILARRGARLVADPHPEQNFFRRSDTYALALRGVVAHTVSSFGLHTDYHRPSDEIPRIDFPFLSQSISSLIAPIRWLANSSFRPAWLPGRAPTRE